MGTPQFERHKGLRSLWFAPSVLLAGLLLVSLTVIWLIQGTTSRAKQSRLDEAAASTADNLRLRVQGNLDFLNLLAADRMVGAESIRAFQERAAQYVADHPELTNITWVDTNFVVRDVAPLATNRQILGLRLELPEPKRIAHLARAERQPRYTRPFEAIQGRPSFEVWVPVFHENQFLGLLAGVYSVDRLLDGLVSAQQRGVYQVDLVDSLGMVIGTLPALGAVDETLVHQEILIPGNHLTLRFKGQGPGVLEKSIGLLAFLCVALVVGIAFAMWRLRNDSNARARMEEALRESEAQHRALLRTTMHGFWLVDEQGRLLEVNDTYCRMSGYTANELLAMRVHDLEAVESAADTAAHVQRVVAQGEDRFESRHQRKDGSTYDVEVSVQHRPFDGGYLVTFVHDITERKLAEEALRKLSRAVEQSPASIVITNVNAEIEYVNDAFLRKSGYASEEVIGHNPRMLQSGNTSKDTYDALWTALSAGDTWTGEFHNRRKDGSEYRELAVISPLRQADGTITHYVAVKEDITEQQRLLTEVALHRDHLMELVADRTRELVEARELAEAASRAKSAFLATMSHEIRTPLNGVISMAEILTLRPLEPPDLDAAKTIQRSAHNLLAVIDGILDFSKIEAGKLELELADLSLRAVVENVTASLHQVAVSSDVDLSVDVAPDVPEFVRGDATRVQQILLNLAGNAVKFSRGRPETRGRVSVRLELASERPLRVVARISDNGIGMAPEVISRLFTSFTQAETSTTRRYGGTGLGLAISRRLVELMDGTIEVTSEVGLGSTFTVTLPFHAAAPHAAAAQRVDGAVPGRADVDRAPRPLVQAAPLSVADARAQGRLILVAEDDSMNQKVILQQLALLGYAGEIAGDGVEALRLWREGSYAMLLSDLHMPNMDGYELVAAIRREEPAGVRMPVIALTANALRGEAERAKDIGMDGYLTKPVPLAALRDVLDQWVSQAL